MKFLCTVIDLPPSMYSVQTLSKAEIRARIVFIILTALDYGLSVTETLNRVRKTVRETVTETVTKTLQALFSPVLPVPAALA